MAIEPKFSSGSAQANRRPAQDGHRGPTLSVKINQETGDTDRSMVAYTSRSRSGHLKQRTGGNRDHNNTTDRGLQGELTARRSIRRQLAQQAQQRSRQGRTAQRRRQFQLMQQGTVYAGRWKQKNALKILREQAGWTMKRPKTSGNRHVLSTGIVDSTKGLQYIRR